MKPVAIRLVVLGMLLPLAGCPLLQVKEDDPYAKRVRSLEQRIDLVDKQLDTQSLVQLMKEIEAMRAEVRSLRGQVEQLTYDVEGVRQRQRDIYVDLDKRLQALESGGGSGGSRGNAADSNASDAYMAAFALLRESRYAQARQSFEQFLKDYPGNSLVANVHYWLGQIDYVNKKYDAAIDSFRKVTEKYPDSEKAADALLKIGYSQDEIGDKAASRATLESVSKRYPGSNAAQSATQRLKELGGA